MADHLVHVGVDVHRRRLPDISVVGREDPTHVDVRINAPTRVARERACVGRAAPRCVPGAARRNAIERADARRGGAGHLHDVRLGRAHKRAAAVRQNAVRTEPADHGGLDPRVRVGRCLETIAVDDGPPAGIITRDRGDRARKEGLARTGVDES
jgi:hypothetical protein